MNIAMMTSTECDDPLVANLSSKCAALRKAQMMGIGRCAAADKARLGRDEVLDDLCPERAAARDGQVRSYRSPLLQDELE